MINVLHTAQAAATAWPGALAVVLTGLTTFAKVVWPKDSDHRLQLWREWLAHRRWNRMHRSRDRAARPPTHRR